MKILINAHVFGWRMTGLLGKDAGWFCGFSKRPREQEGEPRLVSYAPDGSTCTLNFDGEEHYYSRTGRLWRMTEAEMIAEEAKDPDLLRLLPCPFCGGGITEFKEDGRMWTGMKYSAPVSVSVRHWCASAPGPSRSIERIGRDKEQAIERWNMRHNVEGDRPPRTSGSQE